MQSFLEKLDTVVVPDNYEDRFLDIMNSFADAPFDNADVSKHTLALAKIIAYHDVSERSNKSMNTKKQAKVVLPYSGTVLTRSQLGYRVSLTNIPATLRRRLFAYAIVATEEQ
jgi:hypothetical protein